MQLYPQLLPQGGLGRLHPLVTSTMGEMSALEWAGFSSQLKLTGMNPQVVIYLHCLNSPSTKKASRVTASRFDWLTALLYCYDWPSLQMAFNLSPVSQQFPKTHCPSSAGQALLRFPVLVILMLVFVVENAQCNSSGGRVPGEAKHVWGYPPDGLGGAPCLLTPQILERLGFIPYGRKCIPLPRRGGADVKATGSPGFPLSLHLT